MKRLVVGLVLLAVLLGLSAWAVDSLARTAEAVEARLLDAWELSLSGDLSRAGEKASEAAARWQQSYGLAASLADHERLREIDLGFGKLLTDLRQGDGPGFARNCYELVLQVRLLAESEELHYYNFL